MRTFAQKQNQPQKKNLQSWGLNLSRPGPDYREQLFSICNGGLTDTSLPRFGHDFSGFPAHPPAAGAIQTTLGIGRPGDEYEQEADRISEQVMRMPEPQLQRACACGGTCPKCQTVHKPEPLQNKRVGSGELGETAAPPIVHEVLRSPGQPLDPATRAFMEPRFGHDFSRVRVHSDAAAEQSASEVNANAYTVGSHIVFGAGLYQPHSSFGGALLAHELTHVVQQLHSSPDTPPGLVHEREADAAADAVWRGAPVSVASASGIGIARTPEDKPAHFGPTVTQEIMQQLIIRLEEVRVGIPFEKAQGGQIPSESAAVGQHANRTVSVAAIIKPNGEVTYHWKHFDEGMPKHAEAQLLEEIGPLVESGDTVALATDQDACESEYNCVGVIQDFIEKTPGSVRTYFLGAKHKTIPEELVHGKTAIKRPIWERLLVEIPELSRIRLLKYAPRVAVTAARGATVARGVGGLLVKAAPAVGTGLVAGAASLATLGVVLHSTRSVIPSSVGHTLAGYFDAMHAAEEQIGYWSPKVLATLGEVIELTPATGTELLKFLAPLHRGVHDAWLNVRNAATRFEAIRDRLETDSLHNEEFEPTRSLWTRINEETKNIIAATDEGMRYPPATSQELPPLAMSILTAGGALIDLIRVLHGEREQIINEQSLYVSQRR